MVVSVDPLGSTTASLTSPLLGLVLLEQFMPSAPPPTSASAAMAVNLNEFRLITVSSQESLPVVVPWLARGSRQPRPSPKQGPRPIGPLPPRAEITHGFRAVACRSIPLGQWRGTGVFENRKTPTDFGVRFPRTNGKRHPLRKSGCAH